jgi:hypothetical protein
VCLNELGLETGVIAATGLNLALPADHNEHTVQTLNAAELLAMRVSSNTRRALGLAKQSPARPSSAKKGSRSFRRSAVNTMKNTGHAFAFVMVLFWTGAAAGAPANVPEEPEVNDRSLFYEFKLIVETRRNLHRDQQLSIDKSLGCRCFPGQGLDEGGRRLGVGRHGGHGPDAGVRREFADVQPSDDLRQRLRH